MENNRLRQQIQFLLEIDRLKNIIRRNYLTAGIERRENSAEHSWHLTIMAMLMAEYAETPVNLLNVMKMLTVHDLVEIDAGDTYCYDENAALDKEKRERDAADRIFGILPADQGKELRHLWEEFEAQRTPEAKFARALDCLMPMLHNYHTKGKSWKEHGIVSRQVLRRVSGLQEVSDTLWQFACSVIRDAVKQGYLSE